MKRFTHRVKYCQYFANKCQRTFHLIDSVTYIKSYESTFLFKNGEE